MLLDSYNALTSFYNPKNSDNFLLSINKLIANYQTTNCYYSSSMDAVNTVLKPNINSQIKILDKFNNSFKSCNSNFGIEAFNTLNQKINEIGKSLSLVVTFLDNQLYMEENIINSVWLTFGGSISNPTEITLSNGLIVSYKAGTLDTGSELNFKKGNCELKINEIIKNVLLGETPQKPVFDQDGQIPEDFKFGDSPQNSITSDPLFAKSNSELISEFKSMVEFVSTEPLESVIKQMIDRFATGFGGSFSSQTLNDAVHATPQFDTYYKSQINNIQNIAGGLSIDKLKNFPKITLDRFSFPTLDAPSLLNGLVIIIHQVWAIKIELKDVTTNNTSKTGKGSLVITMYDHFGLDAPDIAKFGGYPVVGKGFKAWYILQHYRNAKPFVTEMKISVPVQLVFN